jgi:hypothetical protein
VKRFFACLLATIGLASTAALVGVAPAGAGLPAPSYDCTLTPAAPGGLEGFDDVPVPIDVTDRTDPVPPGGTATYDVNLSLPALGELPLPDGVVVAVIRLSVEVPIPEGVTDVQVAFANPVGQTANPPVSRWFDESDEDTLVAEFRRPALLQEIQIHADGSYTFGGQPVVAPAVSFTATLPSDPNTDVEWTVPDLSADLRIISGHALACTPDAPETVIVSTSTCDAEDFTDITTSHPFYCDIAWMNAEGISTGFEPGPTYKPSVAVSRQAMSAFLYRFAGSPAFSDPGQATFADVSTSNQFFTEIEWMAAEGISTGTPASPKPLYKPSSAVSRGAMAAFMYRFAEATDEAPGSSPFVDVSTGHPFFKEIAWMNSTGISTGYLPGPEYRPSAVVSRQAMSAFLNRLSALMPA